MTLSDKAGGRPRVVPCLVVVPFADRGNVNSSNFGNVGGNWNNGDNVGPFNANFNNNASNTNTNIGARLAHRFIISLIHAPPPYGGMEEVL